MRVLFVSGELIGADLCYRLKKEGCDVRLYIEDESQKDCFEGMVKKTNDWRKELKWVGKDGLIVFDDVGYGKIQDELRAQGHLVVGGSEGGDKLEKNREFAQKVFTECGMDTVPTFDFSNLSEAIRMVQSNKGKWVIKQNRHLSIFNYVGELEDGSDVINVLDNYRRHVKSKVIKPLSLQKKVEGVEIGVGRYFNGKDWIGPIEINIEHKNLFNGDIGPQTGEMGTIIWFEDDENNRLFQKTLAKLKHFLQCVNFKGDADIDCIVNNKGVIPLEATMRFGCPSSQLQTNLILSPWKEFLLAIAKGEDFDLRYKKEKGVIVSLAIPPFPYKSINADYYLKGVGISFKKTLTTEEMNRLHFDEISLKKSRKGGTNFVIAGNQGFILYISGCGNDLNEARTKAYSLIDKIIIPKMFYRTDIGMKFINHDMAFLKKWGYL